MARTVTDPGGTEWTVRPRWRLGPEFRLRRRRKERKTDAWSELGFLGELEGETWPMTVGLLLIGGAVVVLVVFVLFPVFALAIELIVWLVLLLAGLFARFVLGKPWIVEATTADQTSVLRYRVKGYRAMREVSEQLAGRIAAGDLQPTISGTERV